MTTALPNTAAPTSGGGTAGFDIEALDGSPAALVLPGVPFVGRSGVPLVELFTSEEQRGRTSQAYVRSAIGQRLRVAAIERWDGADGTRTVVTQHDPVSGLQTRSTVTQPEGVAAARVETRVRNTGAAPVVLTAVTSLSVGFGATQGDLDDTLLAIAHSEWLAENRWREVPVREVVPEVSLDLHGQDGRGHFGWTSHGAWSSGERLPCGVLTGVRDGVALAWQVETSAGWHVDLTQTRDGGVLALLGPTDLEHQFAYELQPGQEFVAVPAAIAVAASRDGALGEMTAYRRWLRAAPADAPLPVVYNDFMNTLMGQPSTEKLLPLVAAAEQAGAEVFCIDAGWFADPAVGDWWDTVGEWVEAPARFGAGLRQITDEILARGMRVGLWLEPEVVGVKSPAAAALPDEAFFWRYGRRVQEDRRHHLDFRHPAARRHMDEVVDRLVREYGVSYLKLDYNINPGAGTDRQATGAGAGLLGHTRALRDWLVGIQLRHPGLDLENCSSGAMRADYALLDVTHLQSTSDQQDFRLYPPIAASAPASILPEQCGNWAYPAAGMDPEETAFTLVSGLSGRLYLSGFLDQLTMTQRALVDEAVRLHKRWRGQLSRATPFWPLGLPAWDAAAVCLGLHVEGGDLLFVWDREQAPTVIDLPGVRGPASQLFPSTGTWESVAGPEGLRMTTRDGIGARVLFVPAGEEGHGA